MIIEMIKVGNNGNHGCDDDDDTGGDDDSDDGNVQYKSYPLAT